MSYVLPVINLRAMFRKGSTDLVRSAANAASRPFHPASRDIRVEIVVCLRSMSSQAEAIAIAPKVSGPPGQACVLNRLIPNPESPRSSGQVLVPGYADRSRNGCADASNLAGGYPVGACAL